MSIKTKTIFLSEVYKSEDQFCASVNMYVSHNYEMLRGMYFHIANERQDVKEAIKARSMGVLPGVPDFRFEDLAMNYPVFIKGWYLELKLPNGILSKAQLKLHKQWRENGIIIEVSFTQYQVCFQLGKRYGQPKYQ